MCVLLLYPLKNLYPEKAPFPHPAADFEFSADMLVCSLIELTRPDPQCRSEAVDYSDLPFNLSVQSVCKCRRLRDDLHDDRLGHLSADCAPARETPRLAMTFSPASFIVFYLVLQFAL